MLLVWLTCIAAPALVIATLAADNVTDVRGAIAFVQAEPTLPEAALAETAPLMGEGAVAEAAMPMRAIGAESRVMSVESQGAPVEEGLMLVEGVPAEAEAMAQTLSQPEAPSATPEAPAPEPPTPTPYVIVITNTPLPPTDTPEPTATPVPPTATPKPVRKAAAASKPKATATPARALHPPRELDPRLPSLNVHVQEPVGLAPGQSYYRLVSARWENEQEAGFNHSIYIDVMDETGNRIVGQPVDVRWGSDGLTVFVDDKPAPEYGSNFPMYAVLGSYSVSIPGLPSDTVVGLGMGTAEQPNFKIHTNFWLKFQRTTW
jgi:hypothetical protein